jgi:hypothetical protein
MYEIKAGSSANSLADRDLTDVEVVTKQRQEFLYVLFPHISHEIDVQGRPRSTVLRTCNTSAYIIWNL